MNHKHATQVGTTARARFSGSFFVGLALAISACQATQAKDPDFGDVAHFAATMERLGCVAAPVPIEPMATTCTKHLGACSCTLRVSAADREAGDRLTLNRDLMKVSYFEAELIDCDPDEGMGELMSVLFHYQPKSDWIAIYTLTISPAFPPADSLRLNELGERLLNLSTSAAHVQWMPRLVAPGALPATDLSVTISAPQPTMPATRRLPWTARLAKAHRTCRR